MCFFFFIKLIYFLNEAFGKHLTYIRNDRKSMFVDEI